jgi:hypothetical protein
VTCSRRARLGASLSQPASDHACDATVCEADGARAVVARVGTAAVEPARFARQAKRLMNCRARHAGLNAARTARKRRLRPYDRVFLHAYGAARVWTIFVKQKFVQRSTQAVADILRRLTAFDRVQPLFREIVFELGVVAQHNADDALANGVGGGNQLDAD